MDPVEQLKLDIKKLSDVALTVNSPGWKVLQEHFNDVKQAVLDKILIEKDSNEILRLQERYRAFSSVLEAAEVLVEELKLRQQELQELEEFEQHSRQVH